MAGPVLLGNRNIQNPNAETSEMLSRAGSLFNEFQKSKRDERDLRMKEDEFNRQQAVNRNVLNYDPQIGIGGRGLSSETRQAAAQYADKVWKDAQDRQDAGEEVDMKSVLGDIQSTLGGLATREDVYDTVYSDALKMRMNPQEAAQFAASRAAGYISRETLRKEEQEYAKAHAERQSNMASSALGVIAKKQADTSEHNRLLADDRKARLQAVSQFNKDITKLKTNGNNPSKEGENLEAARTRMLDKVTSGWPNWDAKHVDEAIKGFEKYNVDRMAAGLEKIPVSAFETVFNSEISFGRFDNTPPNLDSFEMAKKLNIIFGRESASGASADAITRYYQKQIEDIGAPNYRTTDIPEEFINKLILDTTTFAPRSFAETEQTRAKEAFYNRFRLFRDGEAPTETPAGNREGLPTPVQVANEEASQGTTRNFTEIPAPTGRGLDAAKGTLSAVSNMSGVSLDTLTKFIGLESSFNPGASAEGTTASGYAQINDATWKDIVAKHGKAYGFTDADRNDPRVNMLAGALRVRDITESATKSLGREPSEAEVYTMYVMGPTGGLKLLKEAANTPDAVAADIFPDAAKSNPALFYTDGKERKSPRTLKELTSVFEQKVSGAGETFNLRREVETPTPEEVVSTDVLGGATPENVAVVPRAAVPSFMSEEDISSFNSKYDAFLNAVPDGENLIKQIVEERKKGLTSIPSQASRSRSFGAGANGSFAVMQPAGTKTYRTPGLGTPSFSHIHPYADEIADTILMGLNEETAQKSMRKGQLAVLETRLHKAQRDIPRPVLNNLNTYMRMSERSEEGSLGKLSYGAKIAKLYEEYPQLLETAPIREAVRNRDMNIPRQILDQYGVPYTYGRR